MPQDRAMKGREIASLPERAFAILH